MKPHALTPPLSSEFRNLESAKADFSVFNCKKWRAALLLGLTLVYLSIFLRFFPNMLGGLGHDYAYWFPRMLAGLHWFKQNGIFSVPWFTPALNGGTLLYADPESMYFSFPQFLAFLFDPLIGVIVTFMLFAAIGMLGFYFLLRNVFRCDFWSSFLGAGLFLFNGVYTYRMIVGHLPYHGFMLLPVMIMCLLCEKNDTPRHYARFLCSAAAALLFSYCFYSGGIHFLIPAALSICVCGLIYKYGFKQQFHSEVAVRALWFGIIAGLLCASKLTASLSVMQNLPRSAYPLPGIPKMLDALEVPIRSVFFNPITGREASRVFTNLQWVLDGHEFQYGITFIPLMLIVAYIVRRLILIRRHNFSAFRQRKSWFYGVAIFLVLLLPVCVNFYSPQWNGLLKKIPIIKSSSTLVRWYTVYITTGILLSVLAFDKLGLKPFLKGILTAIFVCIIIGVNLFHDKAFCYVNTYDYRPGLQGFLLAKRVEGIAPIQYVGTSVKVDTPQGARTLHDDAVIPAGVSQLFARFSLFGYQLEFFPQMNRLKVGKVDQVRDGNFNLKNPSCYLFPEENGCLPGDHFKADQRQQLTDFAHYREFQFQMPTRQRVANWVSLITLLACSTLFLSYAMARLSHVRFPLARVFS